MIALLLLTAVSGQIVDNPHFAKSQQQTAFEATVRIYHPASRSHGTAVAVGKRGTTIYFLTAAHLIPKHHAEGRENEDPDNVELYAYSAKNPDRMSFDANIRVLARMPNEDLAVIGGKVAAMPAVMPVCPKDKREFRLPMPVMTVGSKPDGPPDIQFDTVTAKKLLRKPDGTEALYWEANIPQRIGRSGGPMINAGGFVIGIASGTWHQKGYYSYINEIHRSLADNGFAWLLDKPISEKSDGPVQK